MLFQTDSCLQEKTEETDVEAVRNMPSRTLTETTAQVHSERITDDYSIITVEVAKLSVVHPGKKFLKTYHPARLHFGIRRGKKI